MLQRQVKHSNSADALLAIQEPQLKIVPQFSVNSACKDLVLCAARRTVDELVRRHSGFWLYACTVALNCQNHLPKWLATDAKNAKNES